MQEIGPVSGLTKNNMNNMQELNLINRKRRVRPEIREVNGEAEDNDSYAENGSFSVP